MFFPPLLLCPIHIPRPPVVVPRRPHAANDGPTSRHALGPGLAQRTRRGRAAAGDEGGHEGRANDATLGSSEPISGHVLKIASGK